MLDAEADEFQFAGVTVFSEQLLYYLLPHPQKPPVTVTERQKCQEISLV